MALFTWNATFETGHPLIDEQHRKLVTLINELDNAVAVHLNEDAQQAILHELLAYTQYHFSTEEALMAQVENPPLQFEEHKQAHQRFCDKVQDLCAQDPGAEHLEHILQHLLDWLVQHILKADKQLVGTLNQDPAASPQSTTDAETQLLTALHESESRFRQLADAVPAMLWLCDEAGQRTFFNRTWMDYTGATLADLRGERWQHYIHPDDLGHYRDHYYQAIANQQPFQAEVRIKARHGTYHWIHEQACPRKTDASTFIGLNGSGMDIDALKEAERLQRSLNLELRRQVDVKTRGLRNKNQTLLQYQAQLEQEKAEQASLIRQLQETQQQLVQSEKMAAIGHLAAGVAHEINNPVGYVKSNISSLEGYTTDLVALLAAYAQLDSSLPDSTDTQQLRKLQAQIDPSYIVEDLQDLLHESKEGLERIQQIVNDLKDFSRIDNGDWQHADLHHCLDSTLNVAHNELKYKAEVVKEYGAIPEVECLPNQLCQVFMNLLVNAAQAIEERGVICIRTGNSGEHAVWVSIEDNGAGIPENLLEQIFNPFFTTKPVGKGTGLGLSISYSIIEKHQGTISATSAPGQGSTFKITLPVQQNRQP